MAVLLAPTKSNLIKSKSSLALSRKGYELLDKKRNVLTKEMMVFVNKARLMYNEIYVVLEEAYKYLQKANVTLGFKNVEEMSYGIPAEEQYNILLKSVMGIDIPTIKYKHEQEFIPAYGFFKSNESLDQARQKFQTVKGKIYELAEIENSVFKLAKEIERTKKRTNALKYVQIPKYKEQVKYITEFLEEKEREDFFRLKRLKNKK